MMANIHLHAIVLLLHIKHNSNMSCWYVGLGRQPADKPVA